MTEKRAVMAFGRMNPPTTGHEKLMHAVHKEAKRQGASAHIIASHSHDSEKNPIHPSKKLGYLKKVAPKGVNVSVSSKKHPTLLHHASRLHAAGHDHLTVVAAGEREEEFHALLHKYNGKKGSHGHYNFKSIKIHSAGKRDPDAEGTEGISGTKMRAHAKSNDHKSFKKGLPKALHPHADEIMKHVNEELEEIVNFKPSPFQQRAFARKDPREQPKTKRKKLQLKLHGAALDRKLGIMKRPSRADEQFEEYITEKKAEGGFAYEREVNGHLQKHGLQKKGQGSAGSSKDAPDGTIHASGKHHNLEIKQNKSAMMGQIGLHHDGKSWKVKASSKRDYPETAKHIEKHFLPHINKTIGKPSGDYHKDRKEHGNIYHTVKGTKAIRDHYGKDRKTPYMQIGGSGLHHTDKDHGKLGTKPLNGDTQYRMRVKNHGTNKKTGKVNYSHTVVFNLHNHEKSHIDIDHHAKDIAKKHAMNESTILEGPYLSGPTVAPASKNNYVFKNVYNKRRAPSIPKGTGEKDTPFTGTIKSKKDIKEKILTAAEKRKREEVAQAIKRDNPNMPMDKKMAIATSVAKKVAEAYNTPAAEHKKDKKYPRFAALTDLDLNTKNRNLTIDEYSYGPANPDNEEDSKMFWENKADLWNCNVDQVKSMRCGNCSAFNQTPEVKKKMVEALGPEGETIVEKANLGYCEFFEFKCAGARTCDAWVGGGPITEETDMGSDIDEALTYKQRIARKMIMRRHRPKMIMRKRMLARRKAPERNIAQRARKAAIRAIRKRVAGKKGQQYHKLTPQEKIMVDQRVAKKQVIVNRIAKRVLPVMRKAELVRLKSRQTKVNEVFVEYMNLMEMPTPQSADLARKHNPTLASKTKENYTKKSGKSNIRKNKAVPTVEETVFKFIDSIMCNDYVLSEKEVKKLTEKAVEHNVPYTVLKEVYDQGIQEWDENGKHTPQQVAWNKLNAFLARPDLVERVLEWGTPEATAFWKNATPGEGGDGYRPEKEKAKVSEDDQFENYQSMGSGATTNAGQTDAKVIQPKKKKTVKENAPADHNTDMQSAAEKKDEKGKKVGNIKLHMNPEVKQVKEGVVGKAVLGGAIGAVTGGPVGAGIGAAAGAAKGIRDNIQKRKREKALDRLVKRQEQEAKKKAAAEKNDTQNEGMAAGAVGGAISKSVGGDFMTGYEVGSKIGDHLGKHAGKYAAGAAGLYAAKKIRDKMKQRKREKAVDKLVKDQNAAAAAKKEKKVEEMAAPLPTKKQSDTMAKIKQRIVTKKIKQAVREEKDDHHATVEYEKGPMGPDKQKKTVKIPLKKVDTDRGLSRTPESTQKEIRDHEIHKQHKADGWRISKMSYKNRPKHYRIGSGRPFARYE